MNAQKVIFAIFGMSLCLSPLRAEDPKPGVLLGTVRKDTVFTIRTFAPEANDNIPLITLLQGTLETPQGRSDTTKCYEFHQAVLASQKPYHWRIVGDIYWGCGSIGVRRMGCELKRLPLSELPLFDVANAKRKEQYANTYPKDAEHPEWAYSAHSVGLEPMSNVCYKYGTPPEDIQDDQALFKIPTPTAGIFFDNYPMAGNQVSLFVLDRGIMRLWSGKTERSKKTDGLHTDWSDDKKEIESFSVPFKEPFTVFVRNKDYYFVTESGNIYLSRPPAEKEERKVEQVWDSKRQPVRALITDASNDKVYCFVEPSGMDKKDADRIYFELAAKPEPTRYKLKKIEGVKIDDTLKGVLEYTQVLRDDKRLK